MKDYVPLSLQSQFLSMKIKINQNKCLGCGMCVNLCPKVFELQNGRSSVKKKVDLEKNKECVKEAIKNCPVQAITVFITNN